MTAPTSDAIAPEHDSLQPQDKVFSDFRLSPEDFDEYKLDHPDLPEHPVEDDDETRFLYRVVIRAHGQEAVDMIKASTPGGQDFLEIECVDVDTVVSLASELTRRLC